MKLTWHCWLRFSLMKAPAKAQGLQDQEDQDDSLVEGYQLWSCLESRCASPSEKGLWMIGKEKTSCRIIHGPDQQWLCVPPASSRVGIAKKCTTGAYQQSWEKDLPLIHGTSTLQDLSNKLCRLCEFIWNRDYTSTGVHSFKLPCCSSKNEETHACC